MWILGMGFGCGWGKQSGEAGFQDVDVPVEHRENGGRGIAELAGSGAAFGVLRVGFLGWRSLGQEESLADGGEAPGGLSGD
jgi:hypothetical protein